MVMRGKRRAVYGGLVALPLLAFGWCPKAWALKLPGGKPLADISGAGRRGGDANCSGAALRLISAADVRDAG